jgi:hypothetical protein
MVARFFSVKYTKAEKITKWPQNVPNGHKINHLTAGKIDQIAQKYHYLPLEDLKIYTNLDLWVWKYIKW